MATLKEINLSDDPLKNILLMAPKLDEVGQNRVLGVVFGLMAGKGYAEEAEGEDVCSKGEDF